MKTEFNLDAECAAAQKRVAQYVNRAAAQHLRQMREEAQRARTKALELQFRPGTTLLGGVQFNRKYAPQHMLT